jgi:diacylglycerol kinase family enzyme
VSTVAAALAGTDTPLGVLPAGTLNHFARDVGIPVDLAQAAGVIAQGNSIRVDVGTLNGRVFVNNSSIGLYPAMVRVRDRLMTRGWPKRAAMLAGGLAAVWQFPNLRLRLGTSNSGVVTRTPFVFIGNNSYELSGFEVGTREGLQDGVLQVCTVRNPTRLALLAGAARSLFGSTPEIHLDHAPEVHIRTLRSRVRVALDGEVAVLRSPLRYAIWPGALRVLVP